MTPAHLSPTTRRRRTSIVIALAAVAALILPLLVGTATPASAATYRQWTLSGVTFDDGGTLSGTLVVRDDGELVRANLTTSGGNTADFGARTYDSTEVGLGHLGGLPDSYYMWAAGLIGQLYLTIEMPDTTGAAQGDILPLPQPNTSWECTNCQTIRYVNAGSIVADGAVDLDAPLVTVPSNITTEATGPAGAAVTYSATATDDVDGTITPTCDPPSGSTFALGDTAVLCTATDTAGNPGDASFQVTVQDTTGPVVSVPANVTADATGPDGAVVTYGAATATDLVDGSLTPSCLPASGSTFVIGTTTVTCSATDAHTNTGSSTFTVTVSSGGPVLTLPADITTEATGPDGAPVTFSATADDVVDGAVTPVCAPLSGSTFAVGTTPVICTATDADSNATTDSFSVTVVDTTAPVITVPDDVTAAATSPEGATVTYAATATDLVAGVVPVGCSPESGSRFAVGTTTVTCTATDAASGAPEGLAAASATASATFEVTVTPFVAPSDPSSGRAALPVTGVDVLRLLGVAFVCLGLGVALIGTGRRRPA